MSALEAEILAHSGLAAALADWAQVLALSAGFIALFRFFHEKKIERQNSARALYTNFMAASLAEPDLYGGAWSDGSLSSKREQQKYIHYVGGFLWAAEELLREFPGDRVWEETILVTLREHRDYLVSDQFTTEQAGYARALQHMIAKVMADA